jgi:hypothetical protein
VNPHAEPGRLLPGNANRETTMVKSHWLVSENAAAVFCLLGLVAFVAMAVASMLLK